MKVELKELESRRLEKIACRIEGHLEKQKASTIELVKLKRADKEAFRLAFENNNMPEEIKKIILEDVEEAERWI